jgi:hypothetical protein
VISPRHRLLPDNTQHSQQTSMSPVGFEPTIPASERPPTHALDRAAVGIGSSLDIPSGIAANKRLKYIRFCLYCNVINQLPRLECYNNSRQQEPAPFSPNIGLPVYHTVTLGFHETTRISYTLRIRKILLLCSKAHYVPRTYFPI